MPSIKYNLKTKEQWYKKYYLQKMTIADIAGETECDRRTVRKGIDEVRAIKNADVVETELLRSALTMHQADLADTVEQIKLKVEARDITNAPMGWTEERGLEYRIIAKLAEVGQERRVPVQERLGSKYCVKLSLLGQHLQGEPLWRSFNTWWQDYYRLERIRLELQLLLVRLLLKDFKLTSDGAGSSHVNIKKIGPLYYDTAVSKAVGLPYKEIKKLYFDADVGSQYIGYFGEMASVPDNEPHYRDLLFEAWEYLAASREFRDLREAYKKLNKTTSKTERLSEELTLSHYIPGRCRACKRYRI